MATYRQILPMLQQQFHSKINQGEIYDVVLQSAVSFCVTYGEFETTYKAEIIDGLNYYDYRIDATCDLINDMVDDFDIVTKAYKDGNKVTRKDKVTDVGKVTNTGDTTLIFNGEEKVTQDTTTTGETTANQYPDGYTGQVDTSYIIDSGTSTTNQEGELGTETDQTSTTNETRETNTDNETNTESETLSTVYNQHYYDMYLNLNKKILNTLRLGLLSIQRII